jgi:hypothetical protein
VAALEGGAVVLDLVAVPAVADAEQETAPETWSIDDTSLAVWIGSRWTTRQMPVPTLSLVVAAAAAVKVTNGSIAS